MDRIKFTSYTDDGEEIEHTIPSKYEVCDRCGGKGSHVNPNIDGNGISAEEWERDWDEEEREAYMSGRYDVTCHECHGKRVQLAPNFDVEWEPGLTELYEEHCCEVYANAREREIELRYGY